MAWACCRRVHGKPRDKAKVEVGVQIAERWIIAALRHRKFFSLGELNLAIRELLEKTQPAPLQETRRLTPQLVPGSRAAGAAAAAC